MATEKTVKVRVQPTYRVVHDTKEYVEGQTVTVPEHQANEWESYGYVQRVTTTKK
jgi:hypothetical protein